jgi:CMP/dCMP kinase
MSSAVGMNSAPVLAIDGPGGAGKGTLCRRMAERLGWRLLDSGALYRLVALAAERAGISLDDEAAVARLARRLPARFCGEQVFLAEDEVTEAIRSEDCGNRASRVAALPAVRAALVELQRGFRQAPGLVADGRDMGTIIFPDAELKVFLTASAEERAMRRYKQLKEKGFDVNLAGLSAEIAARDRRDAERAVAPLRPAADAIVLDSSEMDIEAVVSAVARLVEQRGLMPRE